VRRDFKSSTNIRAEVILEAIAPVARPTRGRRDLTRVRRDSNSSTNVMTEVSLEAIAAVATLKDVYVLDMHGMTCLFHLPIFKKVLDLLTHSNVFALNMGEDAGIFDRPHFEILASRIGDGTCPVRRWFVESHPTRRKIWGELGLVRDKAHLDKPNIWTLARREDKRKWIEGVRDLPRLAWLVAPESAYTLAKQYNITMQDSTCNWEKACAARADVIADARFLALATIAALPQIQT